uniref:Uncharacterized protein n=1 Tax=Cacopsylla melanoneura TaxID=428564 RepID=A0A8D8XG04_9HEMI
MKLELARHIIYGGSNKDPRVKMVFLYSFYRLTLLLFSVKHFNCKLNLELKDFTGGKKVKSASTIYEYICGVKEVSWRNRPCPDTKQGLEYFYNNLAQKV